MKTLFLLTLLAFSYTQYKTTFEATSQHFDNGQILWNVKHQGKTVGKFIPISAINLVTNQTDPQVFSEGLPDLLEQLRGIATAPDGMTKAYLGSYVMEGKALSHGRPCGDGLVYDYGVVVVNSNGYGITFTHKREISNFDDYYQAIQAQKGTLFFLPSLFRNGKYLSSSATVDKVIVRRETFDGNQIGVILFDDLVTYDQAREIILGLDRTNNGSGRWSKTTHIYMLDGGSTWGQSAIKTNGTVTTLGSRDPSVVTNYLVFY